MSTNTDDREESTASDDRQVFERLAERFEGEPVGEIAETVLQSFNEEANS